MQTCKFCGKGKQAKGFGKHAIILIQASDDLAICNECLAKAKALINDVGYTDEKIIHINSPLTPEVA